MPIMWSDVTRYDLITYTSAQRRWIARNEFRTKILMTNPVTIKHQYDGVVWQVFTRDFGVRAANKC